jgi:hypothetical protein
MASNVGRFSSTRFPDCPSGSDTATLYCQVILWKKVSRPACLVVRHPSRTRDEFFPSFFNYFWTVTDLVVWEPSLTRSRVCSFHFFPFLLEIASTALFRSESHMTQEHMLLFLFSRLPQPGGNVPAFISPHSLLSLDLSSYYFGMYRTEHTVPLLLCHCSVQLFPRKRIYLQHGYLAAAAVHLFIPLSLPSNVSTCHDLYLTVMIAPCKSN